MPKSKKKAQKRARRQKTPREREEYVRNLRRRPVDETARGTTEIGAGLTSDTGVLSRTDAVSVSASGPLVGGGPRSSRTRTIITYVGTGAAVLGVLGTVAFYVIKNIEKNKAGVETLGEAVKEHKTEAREEFLRLEDSIDNLAGTTKLGLKEIETKVTSELGQVNKRVDEVLLRKAQQSKED